MTSERESLNFLDQMEPLQSLLAQLSEDITTMGEQTNKRMDEVESIAAHVMAIEAVLAVMLKTHPVDADALKAEVSARTRPFSDDPNGSPTVHAVALDIIGA